MHLYRERPAKDYGKSTFCIDVLERSPVGFAPFLDQLCQYIVRITLMKVDLVNSYLFFFDAAVFFPNKTTWNNEITIDSLRFIDLPLFTFSDSRLLLQDYTVWSGYWHHSVVCTSVCLSVTLSIVALRVGVGGWKLYHHSSSLFWSMVWQRLPPSQAWRPSSWMVGSSPRHTRCHSCLDLEATWIPRPSSTETWSVLAC